MPRGQMRELVSLGGRGGMACDFVCVLTLPSHQNAMLLALAIREQCPKHFDAPEGPVVPRFLRYLRVHSHPIPARILDS